MVDIVMCKEKRRAKSLFECSRELLLVVASVAHTSSVHMSIANFPSSTFQIGYNRSKEILSGNDPHTSLQSGKVPDNTEDTNHTPSLNTADVSGFIIIHGYYMRRPKNSRMGRNMWDFIRRNEAGSFFPRQLNLIPLMSVRRRHRRTCVVRHGV